MAGTHRLELTQSGPATDDGVRALMHKIGPLLADLTISPARMGDIEIALTEALNNVAEHAYAGGPPGMVHVTLSHDDHHLNVTLRDAGRAMPGLAAPDPGLPDSSGPLDSLPEGGFGWHLIRELATGLDYTRADGQNHLTLRFDIAKSPPA